MRINSFYLSSLLGFQKKILVLGMNKKHVFSFIGLVLTTFYQSLGQDSIQSPLKISAFIDTYYNFSANKPSNATIPYFVSMNRHNELTLNIAFVEFAYQKDRLRAKFTPGLGTYMESNYAQESPVFRNVVEANVGIKLFQNKDIWLDVGIMNAPYTYENHISKDQLIYTRTLAAEFSPYYLSGLKLFIPLHTKLNLGLYLINGWQQIQDVNAQKSFTSSLEYKISGRTQFNWTTYIGNEQSKQNPDFGVRYFSDFSVLYNIDGKFSFISGFYIGKQDRKATFAQTNSAYWWQGNTVVSYRLTPRFSLAGRVEYFNDPSQIQATSLNVGEKFQVFNSSLGLNVKLFDQALFRMETRYFSASKNVFQDQHDQFRKTDLWFVSSLSCWF